MGQLIKIIVTQDNKESETKKEYDKMIWSGLSWGVVEVNSSSFDRSKPLFIECSTSEKQPLTLRADVHAVMY